MEDRLQDVTIAIGDVSILPVEANAVISAVLVPEAQRGVSRHRPELLIEGAISQWLVILLLAIGILLRVAACECGMSSAVYKVGGDHRIVEVAVNYPRREGTGFESFVLNEPGIANVPSVVVIPRERRVRIASPSGDRAGRDFRSQRA
jgi:hypothetical protein